jgi:hypothetical protein
MSFSAALNVSPNDVDSGASSPLGALAQWNEAQKGGLANQGLALQNQQSALMLGLRGQLAGAIGVGPNGQPMAGGAMPMAGGPGGMPMGPGGGGGGGGDGGGGGIQPVSPYAVMSPYGVPMPRAQMISAVMSNDPMKAITDSYNMGRQRVTQLMTQAGDTNDPDPAKRAQAEANVKAAAGQLYTEGWIDPRAYAGLMADPAKSGAFIRGAATPDAHMGQVTALGVKGLTVDSNGQVVYDPNAAAGLATTEAQIAEKKTRAENQPLTERATSVTSATEQAKAPWDIVTVNVRNADGSSTPTQMSRAAALAQGLPVPEGGAAASSDAMNKLPKAQQDMVQRVAAATGIEPNILAAHKLNESGVSMTPADGPAAVGGPSSGVMQMQKGTLDTYNQRHGTHFTTEDIDATKGGSANLAMQVGAEHLMDLRKEFNGNPVNASIAYNWGAGATHKWLDAGGDPSALPASVQKYVAGIYGPNAIGGGATTTLANTSTPVGAAPPAAGAPAAPATPAGVIGQGVTEPSAQQKADIEQQKTISVAAAQKNIDQVTEYQTTALEKAQTAQRMNNLITQGKLETAGWTSGTFADHKMEALKVWDTIRNNVNSAIGKNVFGAPNQSVGNWEAFNKDMLANVSQVVKEVSPRAAVQEFNTLQKAQPQDETSPQGMRHLFDQMQGIGDWVQAKSQAAAKLDKATGSTNEFEANWNNAVTPTAFIVHRMSTDDFKELNQTLSQTKEGRAMRDNIVSQMKWLDSNGFFNPNNAGTPMGNGR